MNGLFGAANIPLGLPESSIVLTTTFFAKSITLTVPDPSLDTKAKGAAWVKQDRVQDKSKPEISRFFFMNSFFKVFYNFLKIPSRILGLEKSLLN